MEKIEISNGNRKEFHGGGALNGTDEITFQRLMRRMRMRFAKLLAILAASGTLLRPQAAPLKTAEAVLEKYQQALGGVDAIRKVQSETRRGEADMPGPNGKVTFVSYSKPFKFLQKVTLPDGRESQSGFDGTTLWTIDSQGASIDKSTPVESIRRDADLYYSLHQPDYFQKLELAGVTDFEGHRCYWLHGTTHWGKDNNQFYDVDTGLLAGYRFQSDSSASAVVIIALFQDYKSFGGPLVATRNINRSGSRTQSARVISVTYEPLADSLFDLPPAVKALLK
jgi:hypothetical protein